MTDQTQTFGVEFEFSDAAGFEARMRAGVDAFEGLEAAIDDTAAASSTAASATDKLERELVASGRSADKAAAAYAGVAEEARDAAKAEAAAGDAAAGLNDKVKNGLAGFDELQGRLGQVTNAMNLLSGVAIVGAISGFRDSVVAIYEMTAAGKAAKEAAEDHTKALDATVTKLLSLSDVTRAATRDVVAFYRAQVESERVQRELKPLLEERIELERELEHRQKTLMASVVSGSEAGVAVATLRLTQYSIAISEQDAKIAALTGRYKAAAAEVTSLGTSMESTGRIFRQLSSWYDEAFSGAEARQNAAAAAAEAANQQREADARAAQDMSDFIDGLYVDAALDSIVDPGTPLLDGITSAYEMMADSVVGSLDRVKNALIATEEERAEVARRTAVAQAASLKAGAGVTRELASATGQAADAFGADEGAKAVIARLVQLADAAAAIAEVPTAGPAAPIYIAKAGLKLVAAAAYSKVAAKGGKGGGGGGAPAISTGAASASSMTLPSREGEGGRSITIDVDGTVLDPDGIGDAVHTGLRRSGVQAGRPAVSLDRTMGV